MRLIAILLAGATVIFALITLHHSREPGQLHLARATPPAVAAPQGSAPARGEVAVRPQSPSTQSGAATVEVRAKLSPYDRELLADMQDPARRRARVERQKSFIRQQSPYLEEYLQLGEAKFDAFLDLVASVQLAQQEQSLRCLQQAGCHEFLSGEARQEALSQEIAREYGLSRAQRYDHYLLTAGERQYVSQMRTGLSDPERLDDARAEQLIDALSAERVRIHDEIEARSEIAGLTLDGVPFVLSPDATMATLMEQAEEYFRRLRLRAAPLLSTDQLAAYDRMQGERLRRLPYMLKGVVPETGGTAP